MLHELINCCARSEDPFLLPAVLLSIFTVLTFLCFYILFHSCCSYAQVSGKTLAHEFPISYSYTEWFLLYSLSENGDRICKQSAVKLNSKTVRGMTSMCSQARARQRSFPAATWSASSSPTTATETTTAAITLTRLAVSRDLGGLGGASAGHFCWSGYSAVYRQGTSVGRHTRRCIDRARLLVGILGGVSLGNWCPISLANYCKFIHDFNIHCSLLHVSYWWISSDPEGTVGPSNSQAFETYFFLQLCLFPYSLFASCIPSRCLCFIPFLPFPCASVRENTLAWISQIAILNGKFFFARRNSTSLALYFAYQKINFSNNNINNSWISWIFSGEGGWFVLFFI